MGGRLNPTSRGPLLLALPLVLLALAGCRKEQPAEGVPPHLATPRTAEVNLADHAPPPATVPPLRRAGLAAQDMPTLERISAAMAEGLRAAPVVTAAQDGAQIRIRAVLASPAERVCDEELKHLAFQRDSADGELAATWMRTVTVADRPAFEKQVLARLSDMARRLVEVENVDLQCRAPGHMVWQPGGAGSYLPGALVYTGHPMDVALSDAGKDPRLFFAVEGRAAPTSGAATVRMYVRGGPLFVTDDGVLRMGDYSLAGVWKRAPDDTEQITVRPDGAVLALAKAGAPLELGRLQVVKLGKLKPGPAAGTAASDEPPQPVDVRAGASPLRVGHLEFAFSAEAGLHAMVLAASRRALSEVIRALAQPAMLAASRGAAAPAGTNGPIVIHADLAWTERHLKALGVAVERTPGRTTIPLEGDPHKVADALTKVLQVLRQRMAIHEQNLRSADRVRDADNRVNPYRRRIIKIGPQGEAVEEADPTPFPRTYKPGDPNADADGYVTMPNVNRALETAEFQADAEEYRLVRAAMERLAPQQIFPDPPALPHKTEGP